MNVHFEYNVANGVDGILEWNVRTDVIPDVEEVVILPVTEILGKKKHLLRFKVMNRTFWFTSKEGVGGELESIKIDLDYSPSKDDVESLDGCKAGW